MEDIKQLARDARSSLIQTHPFYGALSMRLKIEVTDKYPTAATDGRSVFINEQYFRKLSHRQRKGLFAHEVWHCSNGHIWRRDGRVHKPWNQACDYAINPAIIAAGMELPDGALINPEWVGWSAERIYPLLLNEQEEGGERGDPMDELVDPEDGDEVPTDKEVEAEWRVVTIQAIKQAKLQGDLPAGVEELLERLTETPRVSWREATRRWAQERASEDYSWSHLNRRYIPHGMFMPGLHSERMGPLVVGVDTSGSIDNRTLQMFGSEVDSIVSEVKPSETHVVYCDAEVNHVDVFYPGDPIVFNRHGGGGTSFVPVFDWVEQQGLSPAGLIYLTDTYGQFPDRTPGYPTLWASTIPTPRLPFGEMVYIGD